MATAQAPPKEVETTPAALTHFKLTLPPGGVGKGAYKICPDVGDGGCGHLFTWLEELILPALSTTAVVTVATLVAAVDAVPLDQQHPRWSQVWGDKQPQRYPTASNHSIRGWCIRETLAHAARQIPPRVIIHHKVGGTRYNGYRLPE